MTDSSSNLSDRLSISAKDSAPFPHIGTGNIDLDSCHALDTLDTFGQRRKLFD